MKFFKTAFSTTLAILHLTISAPAQERNLEFLGMKVMAVSPSSSISLGQSLPYFRCIPEALAIKDQFEISKIGSIFGPVAAVKFELAEGIRALINGEEILPEKTEKTKSVGKSALQSGSGPVFVLTGHQIVTFVNEVTQEKLRFLFLLPKSAQGRLCKLSFEEVKRVLSALEVSNQSTEF